MGGGWVLGGGRLACKTTVFFCRGRGAGLRGFFGLGREMGLRGTGFKRLCPELQAWTLQPAGGGIVVVAGAWPGRVRLLAALGAGEGGMGSIWIVQVFGWASLGQLRAEWIHKPNPMPIYPPLPPPSPGSPYRHALAGGIGVAAALSLFQELPSSPLLPVLLIWTARHPAELQVLAPLLLAAAKAKGVALTAHLHYTGMQGISRLPHSKW